MAVKTVGEMVHGHTFDSLVGPYGPDAPCSVWADALGITRCERPYNEHTQRPPLARSELDKEPFMLDRYGFMDAHKFGCGAVTEVAGTCCCGYLEMNVGTLVWLATKGLGGYEDNLRPGSHPAETLSSTEFRTSYAGLEQITDVTVNDNLLGRWIPVGHLNQVNG
jgi:hypothetical protein